MLPSSKRPGTPASRMPQVAGEAIKERAKRLRATGEAALKKRLALEIGATRQVLIEGRAAGGAHGAFSAGGDHSGEMPGAVQSADDDRP